MNNEYAKRIPERIPGSPGHGEFVCLYRGDVMSLFPVIDAGSVQLVVSSPPYNIGKAYETRIPTEEYITFQRSVIAQLSRILSDRGSVCWQVGSRYTNGELLPLDHLFFPLFKEAGFILRNRIIWHYEHGLHAAKRFSGRYETLLWFTKSNDYTFNLDSVRVPSKYPGKRHYKGPNKGKPSGNPNGKNPSDVWSVVVQDWENGIWDIPNVKAHHPEKTVQPCQFPVELVQRCVLALTKPGEMVFDPFAGVGSTLIAAALLGRRSMGAEKEVTYHKIAVQRLGRLRRGTLPIRQLGKPIFVPSSTLKVARRPEEWKRKGRRE